MKYVRRSIGKASADPIGACERQCENIDAGEQALRSRGPNGGLCGPETWTGNMRNEPKTSLSNGGLADSRGAAGRSPNSGLLNHCIVGGLPFEGSRASGKSNGWRER
jgi:hypothetical protein